MRKILISLWSVLLVTSCGSPQLNQNSEANTGQSVQSFNDNTLAYGEANPADSEVAVANANTNSEEAEKFSKNAVHIPAEAPGADDSVNLVRDGLMSEATANVFDQAMANPYGENKQEHKFLDRYNEATEVDSIYRQIQEMLCSQVLLNHPDESKELVWGLSFETCQAFTKDMDSWLKEKPKDYIRSIAILIDELPNDEYTTVMKTLREWFMQTSETIFPVNPSLVWGLLQQLFNEVHALNWKDTALIRSTLKAGQKKTMWDYSRKWMVNISIGLMLARTGRNLTAALTGSRYVSTAWHGVMQRTAERAKWLGNKVVLRQYERPKWATSRAKIKGKEIKTKVMQQGGRAVDLSKGNYTPKNSQESGWLKGNEVQTLGQVRTRIAELEAQLKGTRASTQTSTNLELQFWRRMCFNFKNYVPPNESLEKLILLKQVKGYSDEMISAVMAKEGIKFSPSVRDAYMNILKNVKPAGWWKRWLVAEGSSRLGQVGVEGAWLAMGAAGGAAYGIYRYNNLASQHEKHYKDSALQLQGEGFSMALESYNEIFNDYLKNTKKWADAFEQANDENDDSLLKRALESSEYDMGAAYIHYFKEAQTIMFGERRTKANIKWLSENFKGVVLDETQSQSTLSFETLTDEEKSQLKEGVANPYLPEKEQAKLDESADSSVVKMRKVFFYPEKTARLHKQVVRRAQKIFQHSAGVATQLIQKIEEERVQELESVKAAMEAAESAEEQVLDDSQFLDSSEPEQATE